MHVGGWLTERVSIFARGYKACQQRIANGWSLNDPAHNTQLQTTTAIISSLVWGDFNPTPDSSVTMTTIRNDISRLWVIARIGRYYRALAVADSWLNGRHALEACLRLAAIFSDESNRLPLKAELCLAADWFNGQESPDTARHVPLASPSQQLASQSYQVGREWSPPAPILGAVRFPFLSTCLVSGTSTTAGKPAELKIPELGESVSTMQGLMHTFIDITDLDKVRYCFMLSEYHSATREPWSNRPWSAWQYLDTLLRVCGPDDFEEPEDYTQSTSQEARDLTDRLEKLALIDVAALSG